MNKLHDEADVGFVLLDVLDDNGMADFSPCKISFAEFVAAIAGLGTNDKAGDKTGSSLQPPASSC